MPNQLCPRCRLRTARWDPEAPGHLQSLSFRGFLMTASGRSPNKRKCIYRGRGGGAMGERNMSPTSHKILSLQHT